MILDETITLQPALIQPPEPRRVGVNAWGWTPWGLPFAYGMALHRISTRRHGKWSERSPKEQTRREQRAPNNKFIQNARAADTLYNFHCLAQAMPCHDRPEEFVRLSGACGRPDNGMVQPHALWALNRAD